MANTTVTQNTEMIQSLNKSIQMMSVAGHKVLDAAESLRFAIRLLSCKSNRQIRKIRHGLLREARSGGKGNAHDERLGELSKVCTMRIAGKCENVLNVFVEFNIGGANG
jgi:hypothetical protein